MTKLRMRCSANAPLVLALLCAIPARAFVARAPLSARLPLARQGKSSALAMARRAGLPGVRLRQGTQLSMHMDYQGLVNAAALVGAALPDTPLTTNLGVPSPVLMHQVLFLASNLSYLIAGAAILRKRASPKTVMGVGLWAIGLASTLFHYFQCIMPVGSPVTTAFCALDSIIACSLFPLFGITCWKALIRPTPRLLIVWPLAFACYLYVGPYYTLTHALWHLTTAYGAYSIVEDRDDYEASGRPSPQLAFWSGALAAVRERSDNAVFDLKQRAKKALASAGARS